MAKVKQRSSALGSVRAVLVVFDVDRQAAEHGAAEKHVESVLEMIWTLTVQRFAASLQFGDFVQDVLRKKLSTEQRPPGWIIADL